MGEHKYIHINKFGILTKDGDQLLSTMNGKLLLKTNLFNVEGDSNIKFVTNSAKIKMTHDRIIMKNKDDKFEINHHHVLLNNVSVANKSSPTSHMIIFDKKPVEFDCQDRVQINQNKIYCGDSLYYEFVNNNFVFVTQMVSPIQSNF